MKYNCVFLAAIRLDAEEFLKHFASDGQTAILEEAMSPIGVINGEVLKSQDHAENHDWKTLKTLIENKPFNEIMKYRYPGIRYVKPKGPFAQKS